MKKNSASIGSDVIENILRVYPQLNVVWLITGEGAMLKKDMRKEPLEFDEEKIIEQKIKERQEQELKRLLIEVSEEIERSNKNL
jgi:hypothetical protein